MSDNKPISDVTKGMEEPMDAEDNKSGSSILVPQPSSEVCVSTASGNWEEEGVFCLTAHRSDVSMTSCTDAMSVDLSGQIEPKPGCSKEGQQSSGFGASATCYNLLEEGVYWLKETPSDISMASCTETMSVDSAVPIEDEEMLGQESLDEPRAKKRKLDHP